MSDKLNETFQKHLKLLHEHLNISEAYGDPAHLDWAMRDKGQRPDWDPDGVTGIKEPSPYRKPRTLYSFAKDQGWDSDMTQTYIYWLNKVKFPNSTHPVHYDTSEHLIDGFVGEFNVWLKKHAQESREEKEKELEKKFEREIENISDDLATPMSGLIKTFGTFGWQKYKRKNPEEKTEKLLDQAVNNEEKVKKEIGDNEYDTLLKYLKDAAYADLRFNDYEKKKSTEIMNRTIEKAEKLLGRGFFE